MFNKSEKSSINIPPTGYDQKSNTAKLSERRKKVIMSIDANGTILCQLILLTINRLLNR